MKRLGKYLAVCMIAVVAVVILSGCGQPEFDIKFMVDGTHYATVTTGGNETIKMPQNPEKDEYIFDGWYWDNGTWLLPFTVNSLLDAPLSSDMSVYAKWKPETPETPDEQWVEYSLNGLVVSSTILGDTVIDAGNMTADEKNTYDALISLYGGRTIKISESNIQFGGTLSLYGSVGYTTSGDTVSLNESALTSLFNYVKLSGGVFSLGFGTPELSYAFEYYAPGHTVPKFTVSFETGTDDVISSKQVEKNKAVPKPADPVRAGYTFAGWYGDANYNDLWSFSTGKVTKDMTLYAKWAPDLNTVVFNSLGGSNIISQKVYTDRYAYAPVAPTMTGHTFLGWYLDTSFDREWDFAADPVTGYTELFAKWGANTYKVTFDAQGGITPTAFKDVEYAGKFGTLPTPARDGFTFAGWYTQAYGAGLKYTASDTYITTQNMTLYAAWETTVTLDSFGIGSSSELKVIYGQFVTLTPLSNPNATFVGWSSTPPVNDTTVVPYFKYETDGPSTYYAVWRIVADVYGFDGNWLLTSAIIKGGTINNFPDPTRPGYTFDGWYDDADKAYDSTTVIERTGNFTITGRWTANDYKIVFNNQGGSGGLSETKVTYDAAIGALPTPTREGFTFAGWYTEAYGNGIKYDAETVYMTAGEITLYAAWQTTVTFNTDGIGRPSIYEELDVIYGQKITYVFESFSPNATFSGYYTEKSGNGTLVTKDTLYFYDGPITIYAKWQLDVSFDSNGGSAISGVTVIKGQTISYLATPYRTGYTFDCWLDSDGNTVDTSTVINKTASFTLTAKWTANEYTLYFDNQGGSGGLSEMTVTYDAALGTLPTPTRAGFTFAGWYTGEYASGLNYKAETVYGKTWDTNLLAAWSTTVTFDSDGVGVLEYTQKTVVYGQEFGGRPMITAENVTQAGWFTEPGGSGDRLTGPMFYLFEGPITAYASWRLDVSFDSNGGSAVSGVTVIKGQTILSLDTPTRTGYTFAGWLDSNGNTVDTGTIINKTENFTLTAKWTANTYALIFDVQGGIAENNKTVTFDAATGILPTPVKAGNVFGGWYMLPGGAGPEWTELTNYTVSSDLTLYAKWTFTITFDYLGATSGAGVESIDVVYNSAVKVTLPTPYKDGWSFESWFTQPDYTGFKLTDTSIIGPSTTDNKWIFGGNMTVYVKWVQGTDKRFFSYSTSGSSTVTITGLKSGNNLTYMRVPYMIDGITSILINYKAFANNTLLSEVYIPSNVTVGYGILSGCSSLVKVTAPIKETFAANTNSYLGYYFLSSSTTSSSAYSSSYITRPESLSEVVINSAGTSLDKGVFYGFSALTKISLPVGITSVGYSAFNGCTALTEVTHLSSVRYAGEFAFYNCGVLENVNDIEKLYYAGASAFYNCKKLASIEFYYKDASTAIGNNAFWGCIDLTEVKLAENMSSIGDNAFKDCSSLTEMTIPSTTGSIGRGILHGCESLVKLTAPIQETYSAGTNSFYGYYFYYWINSYYDPATYTSSVITVPATLEEIVVNGDLKALSTGAFYGFTSLAKVTLPTSIKKIGNSSFYNCTSLTNISGLNNVTYVGDYAFNNCSIADGLNDIEKLYYVGINAFYNCAKLNSIEFYYEEEATAIGAGAFWGCSSLAEIKLVENMLKIGNNAFKDCVSLSEMVIPSTTGSIGSGILHGCNSLIKLTAPILETYIAGTNSFYGYYFYYWINSYYDPATYTSSVITVPSSLKEIVINGDMELLNTGAFYGFKSLAKITMPDTLKTIGANVFYNCISLKKLVIPNSVTTITRGALSGCTSLEKLTLTMMDTYSANNHSYIKYLFGASSFNDNYPLAHLKTVVVSSATKMVADNAFKGLAGLERVIFEGNITLVGTDAFNGCSNLRLIEFRGGVSFTTFETNSFTGTHTDLVISVPDDKQSEYETLFTGYTVAGGSDAVMIFVLEGAVVTRIIDAAETSIQRPADPVWHNRIFEGWYLDTAYTMPYDFSQPLTGAVILYGKWGYETIALKQIIDVEITTAGDYMYYTFTAPESAYYKIEVTAFETVNLGVSPSDSNATKTTGSTPSYRAKFVAGTTYVISVKYSSNVSTGSFSLTINNG